MSLGAVLGVVFIVLKLVGVVDWSWLWVTSPIWIEWTFAILVVFPLACWWFSRRSNQRRSPEEVRDLFEERLKRFDVLNKKGSE